MTSKPLKILTWHVHGNYLYYLTQVPHDFYLVTDAQRSKHHGGLGGSMPWGPNVHEVMVEDVPNQQFDVVLYQSRDAYEVERLTLLTAAQQRLPRIYLEHDPPQESPTNTKHWVDDPDALLVHCTHFNALMWDSGQTPTRVIEHGVKLLSPASYAGDIDKGLVVVNNLQLRGRRLGLDVYQDMAARVPLVLAGMGSASLGGAGEVPNHLLPGFMAQHRFFFNPIRYTSLGLSVLEAMMVGVPVVALATTELATVIRDGETGYIDTRMDRLADLMHGLLRDPGHAMDIGRAGRLMARERFAIGRFVDDWLRVLHEATA